jgi:hypothetical protein
MEAVSTSVTSVNIYQSTWRIIAEDSHLHPGRCDELKSHQFYLYDGEEIQEEEVGWECSAHAGDEVGVGRFNRNTSRDES